MIDHPIAAPWAQTVDQMIVKDVNQNGTPDLLVRRHLVTLASVSNEIGVVFDAFTSSGNPAAGPLVVLDTMPAGRVIVDMAAADFTGDGIIDIAYVHAPFPGNAVLRTLTLLVGTGPGQWPLSYAPAFSDVKAHPLRTGDFNGDGVSELVLHRGTSASEQVNVVDFSTIPGVPFVLFTSTNSADAVHIADQNGDGSDDLGFRIQVTNSSSTYAYAYGAASGGISPQTTSPVPVTTVAGEIWCAGDITGDGTSDIALVQSSALKLIVGAPTTFVAQVQSFPNYFTHVVTHLAFADVDLDGLPELVQTDAINGLGIYTARYDAVTGPGPMALYANPVVSGTTTPIAVRDFDLDGDLDWLGASQSGFASAFHIVENRAVWGTGSAGSAGIPEIAVQGARIGNPAFAVDLHSAAPNAIAVLLLSTAPVPAATSGLLVDTSSNALILPNGQLITRLTSAAGAATFTAAIPNQPALSGLSVYAQWAVLDAGGVFSIGAVNLALSAARTITFF